MKSVNQVSASAATQAALKSPLRFSALWLAAGSMLLFFLIYRSLIPADALQQSAHGDKLMHFSAYAVLMSWFSNIFPALNQRIRLALALVMLGIALEFAQRWTGYRTFELADMAANATGVAAGWLSAPPRLPNYLRRLESFREP